MANRTIHDMVLNNPAAAMSLTDEFEAQQGGANTVGATLTQLKTLLDTLYVNQQFYTFAGNPNGNVTAKTTLPCQCYDSVGQVTYVKIDGLLNNSGWI